MFFTKLVTLALASVAAAHPGHEAEEHRAAIAARTQRVNTRRALENCAASKPRNKIGPQIGTVFCQSSPNYLLHLPIVQVNARPEQTFPRMGHKEEIQEAPKSTADSRHRRVYVVACLLRAFTHHVHDFCTRKRSGERNKFVVDDEDSLLLLPVD